MSDWNVCEHFVAADACPACAAATLPPEEPPRPSEPSAEQPETPEMIHRALVGLACILNEDETIYWQRRAILRDLVRAAKEEALMALLEELLRTSLPREEVQRRLAALREGR